MNVKIVNKGECIRVISYGYLDADYASQHEIFLQTDAFLAEHRDDIHGIDFGIQYTVWEKHSHCYVQYFKAFMKLFGKKFKEKVTDPSYCIEVTNNGTVSLQITVDLDLTVMFLPPDSSMALVAERFVRIVDEWPYTQNYDYYPTGISRGRFW